jgi:hypothetical protein
MAFRQIKSPALADKAVLNTKLDESAVQGQATLTGMLNPADCFTLLYDVGTDSLKKIGADAFFASFSTDDLQETATTQYFTAARAQTAVAGDISSAVLVESNRASAAETLLQSNITAEASARAQADVTLQSNITAEATRATAREDAIEAASQSADTALSSRVDAILSNTDSAAIDSFVEVIAAFQDADSVLTASLIANSSAITTEVNRATGKETENATAISVETARATGAEVAITSLLTAEETARIAADTALAARVLSEEQTSVSLQSQVTAEATRAAAAEGVNSSAIASEITRATGAEAANASNLTDEITARATAITQARTDLGADIVTAKTAAQAHAEAQDTLMIGDATVNGSATNTITDRIATAKAEAITASSSSVSIENVARIAGDAALQAGLDAEIIRATAAEVVNATAITAEETARLAQDADLQNQINFFVTNTDSASLDSLSEIVAAFESADSDMSALVGSNTTALSTEKARAEAAEAVNATAVTTEASTRSSADAGLQSQITAEATARIAADAATLASAKSYTDAEADSHQAVAQAHADAQDTALIGDASVNGTVGNTVTARIATAKSEATAYTTAQVSAEAATRLAADDALSLRTTTLEGEMTSVEALAAQNEIDLRAEEVARASGDAGLQVQITAEATTRAADDATLTAGLSTEVARATAAEGVNAAAVVTERQRAEAVETGLRTDVNTNIGSISANAGAISTEAGRALAAEQVLSTAITTETTRATAAEGLLTSDLSTLNSTVSNILSNTDSDALDSLTEIVAAFQDADSDLSGVMTANSGRLTTVEGRATTLETEMNAVEGRATAVEGRATAVEAEQALQAGRLTTNEGDITALETKLGDGAFDTTAQSITGAIDELHTETSANTSGLAAAVTRADADSDALAQVIVDVDAVELALQNSVASDIALATADYIARDAVVLASAQTYAETEANDAEAAAKTYADGIVASEATLRENADTVLAGQITTEATARSTADNQLDSRATVLEGEMSATQLAAGVNADGTYDAPTGTNYINLSTSLADADKKLDTATKAADTARIAGDTNLQSQLDAEIARATAAEGVVSTDLATEASRATAAEAANGVLITANATAISTESSRAQGVESSLQTQVDFITSNTDADALDSLTEIVSAFQSADGTLTGLVGQNQVDIATNAASVVTETSARIAGDTAVRGEFAAADALLQTAVDSKLSKSGGGMSGTIDMGANTIGGLATGTLSSDAVNKGQMDTALAAQHITQFSTDDLPEGAKNFYRDDLARAAIAVTDVSGEGKVSYNSTSGVLSVNSAKSFVELSDVTDSTITGKEGFVARVKTDGTGMELIDPSQLSFNDSKRQVISGDGAQTTFALDFYTLEANAMVFVGGVIQDPSVHYSIDAVNQTMTFMAAIPVGTQAVVIAQSTNSVGVLDPKSVGLETLADNIKVFEQGTDVIVGTSASVVSSFNKTQHRSAKYVVTVESNGEFETRECLVIHDGTNAYITEYGIIFTGSSLCGDTDVQVNGQSIELTYTATSAGAIVSVAASYVDC